MVTLGLMVSTKMKRRALFSRKPRFVLGMFLATFATFVLAILMVIILLVRENRSQFPDGRLLALHNSDSGGSVVIPVDDDRSVIPAYAILQQQVVYDINAFLYLYTWDDNDETCLATRAVTEAQDIFGGWFGFTLSKHCDGNYQYGVHVDRLAWEPELLLVYGFVDDAKRVNIHWQDGSVKTIRPINDTYMVVFRTAKRGEFTKVNFMDADNTILHTVASQDAEQ